MSQHRKLSFGIAALSACLLSAGALAATDFDQSFLDDYSKLQPRTAGEVADLFGAPITKSLSGYTEIFSG